MKVVLLSCDDGWECLYLNGVAKAQGHRFNDGIERGLYFLVLAEHHGVQVKDFATGTANDEGNTYLESSGRFPDKLKDFEGRYEMDDPSPASIGYILSELEG